MTVLLLRLRRAHDALGEAGWDVLVLVQLLWRRRRARMAQLCGDGAYDRLATFGRRSRQRGLDLLILERRRHGDGFGTATAAVAVAVAVAARISPQIGRSASDFAARRPSCANAS